MSYEKLKDQMLTVIAGYNAGVEREMGELREKAEAVSSYSIQMRYEMGGLRRALDKSQANAEALNERNKDAEAENRRLKKQVEALTQNGEKLVKRAMAAEAQVREYVAANLATHEVSIEIDGVSYQLTSLTGEG